MTNKENDLFEQRLDSIARLKYYNIHKYIELRDWPERYVDRTKEKSKKIAKYRFRQRLFNTLLFLVAVAALILAIGVVQSLPKDALVPNAQQTAKQVMKAQQGVYN